MKTKICKICVFCLIMVLVAASVTCNSDKSTNTGPETTIVSNHLSSLAFDNIPETYINQIKSGFRLFYMHTSHGSQVVSGMSLLEQADELFSVNEGSGSLLLVEYSDDLGYDGDTTWVPITRERLENPQYDYNVVLWSWCGGVSDNTVEGINTYLNAVNGLEHDYPNVTFIYMTGHLDGTGVDGNLYARNNQIRAYCRANNKYLFDFADIESYDPAGNYYPDASDACEWCEQWCIDHDCPDCSCAHSQCFNCYQKGKAFWWLLARIAGWNGN